ncbi:MAG TPA: substrate-binding domain-containing protein [Nitrospirota bacterium]|nr:substrate-binding domain-containing protein [Nitrospirota bacterium]
MKIKTFVTSFIAGAGILAMVGTASANCWNTGTNAPTVPTGDLNVYGASAQFAFWSSEAHNYLAAAGCTWKNGGSWADSEAWDNKSNPSHYVVQADCSGVGGPATVNFRVSSKASYDGPSAVDNQQTPYTDNSCGLGAALNQRPMLNVGPGTRCAFTAGGNLTCGAPSATTGDCTTVNWGASDVAVGDFQQVSGPVSGRNFILNPLAITSPDVHDFCNPVAINFGFFVNKATVTKQSDGTPLDNISTMEARLIFSGALTDWSQLASTPTNTQAIVACARNAGSGTHATLDFMIERPGQLFRVGVGNKKFNESTGNEITCIQSNNGAIGYTDSDRLISFPNAALSGPLSIDGVAPSKAAVINMTYLFTDGSQHAYVKDANAATNFFKDVCLWAGAPAAVSRVNALFAPTCQMPFVAINSLANWSVNTMGTGGCTCTGI